jgi:hypothetical protein
MKVLFELHLKEKLNGTIRIKINKHPLKNVIEIPILVAVAKHEDRGASLCPLHWHVYEVTSKPTSGEFTFRNIWN